MVLYGDMPEDSEAYAYHLIRKTDPNRLGTREELLRDMRMVADRNFCAFAGALCRKDYRHRIFPEFDNKTVAHLEMHRGEILHRLVSGKVFVPVAVGLAENYKYEKVAAQDYATEQVPRITKYKKPRTAVPSCDILITGRKVKNNPYWFPETSTAFRGNSQYSYLCTVNITCAKAYKIIMGVDDEFLGDMAHWDGLCLNERSRGDYAPEYSCITDPLVSTYKMKIAFLMSKSEAKEFGIEENFTITEE